ncbi:hypothetical protein CAPTEDRAFT_221588 [Capitella teleta]|uniref:VWFA domain-containing protein n=1 Tax=Capitella teleta TaxID=283909 RepID=R7UXY3_CAPTE|nr:hypothetical protein CAPTEDRAFT_221588 [Capitella teleta]|eukprot:ELU11438.1 hypothetical protein CAPTEDRAFT_221588 [Capitella teleta]
MDRQKMLRFLGGTPGLEFQGELETIPADSAHGGGDGATDQTHLSKDQCIKLRCVLPKIPAQQNENPGGVGSGGGLTHLIMAADNSGSMAGSPFRQVKEGLVSIVGQCLASEDVLAEVILYNSKAKKLAMNTSDYKQVIEKQIAHDCTNFPEAFRSIQKIAGSRGLAVTRTVVIFLTDGENTVECDKLNDATESFKMHMHQLRNESVVHTLGFSSSHDLKFLTDLTKAGKTEGVYQYCESRDGPQALVAKLLDLFDFATIDCHDIEIELSMANGHKFIADTGLEDTITVNGQVGSQQVEAEDGQVAGSRADMWVVELSAWVFLIDPSAFPNIHGRIRVQASTKGASHFVPVAIPTLTRRVIKSTSEKVLWDVQIQARNISILRHRFSKAVAEKKDLTKYETRMEKIQERLSNVQVYGVAGIKSAMRTKIVEEIASLRKTLDSLLKVLTDFKRGLGDSVSVLARTSDLRYQGQFKRAQARKQRMMDKRARKNIDSAKSAQNKLDAMKVDVTQLKGLSEEARNFFFCVLSQTDITEVLLDGDDAVDCLGFGLAIQRPEHVLDEPTAIRVSVISGTFVSRSAMMDAWKHRIHVDGHMKAHGGFKFLGVTTVGTSNEPINAWLPLYICPTHWERVKILLKPSLGYFCTLDSLGYDYKQMDVMFLVLGNMISQLRPETIGEHQLRLLFAFQRTCAALMKDFELTDAIMELITNFIKSTEGRTRDVVPNLLTLVGYLAALPTEKLLEVFGEATCTAHQDGSTKTDQDKYTEFISMCRKNEKTTAEELNTATFDPSSEIETPMVEMKHCEQWDKAMEIWAKAKLNLLANMYRLNDARKVIEKWKKQCTGSLERSSAELNAQPEDASWRELNISVLSLMAQCNGILIDGELPSNANENGSHVDGNQDDDDGDDDDIKGGRTTLKPFPLQCTRGLVTMPEVLALFSGNLCATGREEVVSICRAMLCQAVQYHNNSKARAAAKLGTLMDFSQKGLETTLLVLWDVYLMFIERQKSALQNEVERAMSEFANFCMIRATTLWAFVGYLMYVYQDRGAGFHDLVQDLTDPALKSSIPGLAEKIQIIVTGKFQGRAVLAKGNAWFPEKTTVARFEGAIGEEAWLKIELEVRSSVAIHVYRESDLPNRHGYCNSNPHIPNWLRIQLGMELLDEEERKKRKRKRTHLAR